ncbi:meprin A subunit beta-like [Centruroides vittatus]|uniref:meprin A subunit beta-like n=1 Tax=Centruroides vittatus TaxID=120091 RepID=UPI00350FE724
MRYWSIKIIFLTFLAQNIKSQSSSELSSHLEENLGVSNVCLMEGDVLCDPLRPMWLVAPLDKYRMWTNRIVPYTLAPHYSDEDKTIILEAMMRIEEISCLTFKEREDEVDYVDIQDGSGCFSFVGRIGGRQILSLHPLCLADGTGIAIHELLHALGYWHEQNRYDRDDYVKIHEDNIIPKYFINFKKKEKDIADLQNLEYDYASILHYGPKMFAVDDTENTITPLNPEYEEVIGQREGLSQLDILRINRRYKCEIESCPPPEVVHDGFVIGEDYSVGKTVQFGCDEGFFLVGSWYSFCRFDGIWSGMHPECYHLYDGHSCNFSEDICGWANHQGNDIEWRRNSGPTSSPDTGPMVDHTSETTTGHYIFVDSSEFPTEGKRARIATPTFHPSGQMVCLTAYYYMWGPDMGQLSVYARFYNRFDVQIWSVGGNQGPEWILLKLAFPSEGLPIQIVFEAILGWTASSDIALDDVVFEDCPEEFEHERIEIETPLPPPPTIVPEFAVFWCNFEDYLCGENDEINGDFYWQRDYGDTPSYATGPSVDRTFGTEEGIYLYIETSFPRVEGERARFMLPTVENTGSMCLTFYYHMYGVDVTTLKVLAIVEEQEHFLWRKEGNLGDLWRSARVELLLEGSSFRIIFEGKRGAGPRGDVAIDDVAVLNHSCTE